MRFTDRQEHAFTLFAGKRHNAAKRNPYRTMAACLAAALCLCLLAAAGLAKKSSKTYTFKMPVPKGLSMGSIPKLLQSAEDAIEKKTGMRIKVVEHPYAPMDDPVPDMLSDMDKKKLDFAMVFAVEYLRYKNKHKKLKARPLFTISMFGKTTYDVCVWTRKDDNIKKVKDLKGKTWGGSHTTYASYLLYKNKIKTDLDDFFGDMEYIADENVTDVMDPLLKKKIDVFIMPDYQVDMVRNADKKYRAIDKSHCTEFEHNWLVVYRKGISKSGVKKFKKAFLNAHKDRDFRQFEFLMKAIEGRFVDYDSKKMKTSNKVAKLMDKYKWRDKEKAFMKKNM